MDSHRVVSDVVVMVLHYLGVGIRFSASMPKIHKLFYQFSQDPEFSELFEGFTFYLRDDFPDSPAVSLAFDKLDLSKLLLIVDSREYEVAKKLADKKFEISKGFSKKEKRLLKKMAQEFKKEMIVTKWR